MTDVHVSVLVPCHNGGAETIRLLGALGSGADGLEAVVVDDASTDASRAILEDGLPPWATLLKPERNLGRAGALNLAARHAKGSRLLILDCDCIPVGPGFIDSHLASMRSAGASVGDIRASASDFWSRYLSAVGARRSKAAATGVQGILALTTANMMVDAGVFESVGGFDPRYTRYGFEDRDFLLRLHASGIEIAHTPSALVDHDDDLDLPTIMRKMRDSGRHSAPAFRQAHPRAYALLGYGAIDATRHPALAACAMPLARLVMARAHAIDRWLRNGSAPFPVKALAARAAAALAFLAGTADAGPD